MAVSSLNDGDLYRDLKLGNSTDFIRLLKIKGDHKLQFKDPMECTLEVVQLRTVPYRCVSYVWGDPKDVFPITVNRKPLLVTKNLLGFLQRIRAGSTNPDGYLWVDAICINQRDIDEKGAQVAMMGSIYAVADQVIAWLGWEWDRMGDASDHGVNEEVLKDPPTETTAEEAIKLLRRLASAFRDWRADGGNPWSTQLSQYAFDAMEMYNMLGIQPADTLTWKALGVFLGRRWFTRAWIIQEAALAQKMVMVCGFQVLSWDDVVDVSVFLYASGWSHTLLIRLLGKDGVDVLPGWRVILFASLQDVCRLRSVSPNLGNLVRPPFAADVAKDLRHASLLLESLVVYTRPSEATDPRDKVFAPLALALEVFPGSKSELPRPVYHHAKTDDERSLHVQRVYTEVAKTILKHNLSALSHVEDRTLRKYHGLRSWVPDFSCTLTNPFSNIPGLVYDATPGEHAVTKFEDECLAVKGSRFDGIEELGPEFNTTLKERDFRPWIRFCLRFASVDPRQQGIVDDLWRTMIGDFDGYQCPASPMTAACFKEYLLVCTAVHTHGDAMDSSLKPSTNWTSWSCFDDLLNRCPQAQDAIPSTQELSDWAERWRDVLASGDYARLPELKTMCNKSDVYALALGKMYLNRRPFVTKTGRLGLAPLSSTAGDQIWFLSGARTPFLFRKSDAGSGYTLLGEAYLHGFMHGEIFRSQELSAFEMVLIM